MDGPVLLKNLGGLAVPPALLKVHVVPWTIQEAETLTLAKGKYFNFEKCALFLSNNIKFKLKYHSSGNFYAQMEK